MAICEKLNENTMPITLVIHGGAGNITPAIMDATMEADYTAGLQEALDKGYEVLHRGGTSIDAVMAAIAGMEDNTIFNAGKGAVFAKNGLNEMDAAIMDGSNLGAGAVAGARNVKNPIKLANAIMLHSGHVMLSGSGVGDFARAQGLEMETDEYFFNKSRFEQWLEIKDTDYTQLDHKGDNLKGIVPNTGHKFGTVGAVACDAQGNLAAGTSTGGMTNKRFGRIGDSPVIGAGTYANNRTCAISCTGHGELFLRAVVAYDVSCLMEYRNLSLQEACDIVIKDKLLKMGGEGGLIGVDAMGNSTFCFNSAGMYRGRRNSDGVNEVAYYGM